MHLSLLFLLLFFLNSGHSETLQPILRPIGSDYGTLGLLQIPNARFKEAGELQVFYNRTSPYIRFGFSLQPFDWMEVAFRYTNVTNIPFDVVAGADQGFKDKAFDVKVRLLEEGTWRPELAVGWRDIIGTSQFGGEFIVASKRYKNFDFTLGLGFGYLGNASDFRNPLSIIDDRFETREGPSAFGGTVEPINWFRGNTALFGGVQWQTPWRRLQLLAEYEGNDYQNEPQNNSQVQNSRFNIGAVYALSSAVDLRLGFERGDALMFGLALHNNLARDPAPRKVADPPPVAVNFANRATQDTDTADWQQAAKEIEKSAGFSVEQIALVENKELVVKGEAQQFRSVPKTAARVGRVLENYAGEEITAFTIQEQKQSLATQDIWIPREEFRLALEDADATKALQDKMTQFPALPLEGQTLYQQSQKRFDYDFGLGFRQVFGGPDTFLLYQLNAQANARYHFRPDLWLDGQLMFNLLNNYEQFTYDAPSGLPRVRTDQRSYLTTSDLTLPVLQLNYATKLGKNTYGLAYAGLLESMFAGVGGEVLYRAPGSRFALGLDINAVQQRGFPQDFTLRDYQVLTGHLSAYFQVYDDILLTVRGGRYLAGDEGITWDIAREFANGVRFGAYATFTNVSAEEFGEGSFDKGIYITLPLDRLFVRSTLRKINITWAPLTRDGGAILKRKQTLFDLTERLNGRNFDNDFGSFLE